MTALARLPDTNRYLAGLMSGLDVRYDLGEPDPLIGARMIDLSLRTATSPTTVSALLRPGRGLLLHLGGGQPSSPQAPLPPSVTWVSARVIDSPVGTALGTTPGIDRVLIRPDGYICWASVTPTASPESALQRWFQGHRSS